MSTHATLAIGVGGVAPTPPDLPRMGPFRYLRFHAGSFGIGFTDQELAAWAERLAQDAENGCESYAYFNNDAEGYAIRDAQRLCVMLRPLAVLPNESSQMHTAWR